MANGVTLCQFDADTYYGLGQFFYKLERKHVLSSLLKCRRKIQSKKFYSSKNLSKRPKRKVNIGFIAMSRDFLRKQIISYKW